MTEPDIKKGLAGVIVDYTAVSKVNPETNCLLYRGYPVQELAATQPFEAVAYLLWHGELPTDVQLAQLRAPSAPTVTSRPTCAPRSTSCRSTRTRWTRCGRRSSLIGASRPRRHRLVLEVSGSAEENLARSVRLFA